MRSWLRPLGPVRAADASLFGARTILSFIRRSLLLIAKESDDGSKIASELSKGTRFQLYLALHGNVRRFSSGRSLSSARRHRRHVTGGLLHPSPPSLRNRDGRRTVGDRPRPSVGHTRPSH